MPERKKLYLLSYDHGGYILWGPHFKERIESAVAWLEKYPKFKIGLDNESFAYDKYSQEDPEIIEAIKEILNKFKGRFGIGSSTYGQPLSVFINEESNVRQLVYAIRTNLKYFETTPPIYAISEHALHSQIPQLIKQAGYKGAIMRTHFMMYGYNPTYDQPYGWWKGEDCTRIPAIPTYDGEGAQFAITTFDNWVLTRWPDMTDQSLEQFIEKFKDIEPLLASRYDDIVLRCEKLVEHTEKNPDYRWVILEDLPEIYEKPSAEFTPTANEFKVRMPWGYCGNKIFNDCRLAETSIGIAERANAAAVLTGGRSMQPELETAWKNLLITQHHDIQICGLLNDEAQYLPQAIEGSKKVLDESLRFISGLFKTENTHNLIVFNPLSWRSKQEVSTEIRLDRGKAARWFKVIHKGGSIPFDIKCLDTRQDGITRAIISFEAEVGPVSANCYSVIPSDIVEDRRISAVYDSTQGILSNGSFEIKLNENGICYIKEAGTDLEYVKSETGSLFRGMINGKDCASKGQWVVSCSGANASAVQVGQIGGVAYNFELFLNNTKERIDCRVTFLHHGEKIGTAGRFEKFEENTNGFVHEDKLRFILKPCISRKATGLRDLPFLVATVDEKYVQGNYWTAISDSNVGIAYFNRGAMCSVREEDGFSIPLEYANEYVWGSRYLYGTYTHEFSIYPFCGDREKAGIHKKAIEYQFPFTTYEMKKAGEGKFDGTVAFADISATDNVVLSAIYPENGSVIARFYEYEGKPGMLDLTSGFAKVCEEVDILGRRTADTSGLQIGFGMHEIKSLRLGPANRILKDVVE